MEPRAEEPSSGTRERPIEVVVVEDDGGSLEMLTALLEMHGCVVRPAMTVEAAEVALDEQVPDVVVTDLQLGAGATGCVLAERMRRDPRLKHVVRIAVTGAITPRLEVLRGFDAYLRKPIDVMLLVELVRERALTSRGQRPGVVAAV